MLKVLKFFKKSRFLIKQKSLKAYLFTYSTFFTVNIFIFFTLIDRFDLLDVHRFLNLLFKITALIIYINLQVVFLRLAILHLYEK